MNREKVKSGKYAVNRARRRARKARLNIVKLVWLTAVALLACAPAMAGDDDRAAAIAAHRAEMRQTLQYRGGEAIREVAADVETVAAGRGWRCSTGGPVVAGGDLSGYECEGDSGKGTMRPLSMYGYIHDALDWEFGDDRRGTPLDARIWVIGSNEPGGLNVTVLIDGEDEGVCYDNNGTDYCTPISKQARTAIMDAAADISVEMRAQFDALKARK